MRWVFFVFFPEFCKGFILSFANCFETDEELIDKPLATDSDYLQRVKRKLNLVFLLQNSWRKIL